MGLEIARFPWRQRPRLRLKQPCFAGLQTGQGAEKLGARWLGQRRNRAAQIPGWPDGQAGGSVPQLAAERRIVVDLSLKDAEAGPRTILPVMTEAGRHQA